MARSKKEIKKEIKQLRAAVTDIVNASDPMGLLGLGAPADEYDAEVNGIFLQYLRVGCDPEKLTLGVQGVFDQWFGPASVPLARSKFIAARLCELGPGQKQGS